MCSCNDTNSDSGLIPIQNNIPRRSFVKLAGLASMGFSLAFQAGAAEPASPPKPQNVISGDEALQRLLDGNRRYINGQLNRHDFIAERPALAEGQNPFAGVLGCADSRVAPEYAFDVGRGDTFSCRVAGNFADIHTVASFEYGVAVLGIPMILVLGHSKCGAVDAAVNAVKKGKSFPGHIGSLVEAIRPAVAAVINKPGDLLENAIRENVRINVQKLRSTSPILKEAVQSGKLKIAGGVYDLETGAVTIV